MVRADKDITLPDGVDLAPMTPDFLNKVWPIYTLDSSMGSLLLVGTIFIVAVIVALILGFIGRGMPRVRGAIFSTLFFGLAIAIAGAGYLTIKHWHAPNAVSEPALAEINLKTHNWLQANDVNVSQRQSLDLVCEYYELKSNFCTGAQPMSKISGTERPIKMHKGQDGYMALIDAKHQIPLLGEGARK